MYLQKKEKGQALLDRVFRHLELQEGDYFGLQFVDTTNTDEVVCMQHDSLAVTGCCKNYLSRRQDYLHSVCTDLGAKVYQFILFPKAS
jgi:FERM N-terminal domain